MASKKHKDWVRHRAKCNLKGVFRELVCVIEKDIETFAALPYEEREGLGRYKCKSDEAVATIGEIDGSNNFLHGRKLSCVRVIRKTRSIKAYFGNDLIFKAVPQWNSGTLECDPFIDDEVYSLWQLSEKAIGDLLFS